MTVRINDPRELADAATAVARALPSRPAVPVLSGAHLTLTSDGTLKVSGFDYEVSTTVVVGGVTRADDDGLDGLVSGRLLAEITKALPAKPVDLAAVGAHLELVCGSARFTLPTMPVEDYPTLPDMPASAGGVDAPAFAAAVAQVAVAAGRDGSLPMMTGVRVELSAGQMSLLATDRYRLAVREIEWQPTDANINLTALVPASTLAAAAKALGAAAGVVRIGLGETTRDGVAGFAGPLRTTTTRLLDGTNYPPVRSLFPTVVNATAVVDVAHMGEVVKRVALVAERATPVLLSFSADGLVVEAGGTEDARASEAMEAAFTGEPLTIGFNPQYLIDGLHAVGSKRGHFSFVDAVKPAVLAPLGDDDSPDTSYRYLIMPIRPIRVTR